MTYLRPFEIEMIRAESREQQPLQTRPAQRNTKLQKFKQTWESGPEGRLIITKPANEWINHPTNTHALKTLFGGFWREGELCMLFADTNLGKSILAVQIADAITRNFSIGPFNNQAREHTPVLYLDCEQSAKQFEVRYTHELYGRHHFSEHFYRAEYNPALDNPTYIDRYQTYIRTEIDFALNKSGARVLIIDNLTYMRYGHETSGGAIPLMKTLKAIKEAHDLSVLVLAHTPKRSAIRPITVDDLAGSKMLINFADSAFAIGQSLADPQLRYLKQIKQRSGLQQYGADNICLIKLQREFGMLGFEFVDFAREADHLKRPEVTEQDHETIYQLHQQGKGLRAIARILNMHYTTVGRILTKIKKQKEIVSSS